MAMGSKFKMALSGAAVASVLVFSAAPSQANGLLAERFFSLKSSFSTPVTSTTTTRTVGYSFGGYKWTLLQQRAKYYDWRLSNFFGRPVSPFWCIFRY